MVRRVPAIVAASIITIVAAVAPAQAQTSGREVLDHPKRTVSSLSS